MSATTRACLARQRYASSSEAQLVAGQNSLSSPDQVSAVTFVRYISKSFSTRDVFSDETLTYSFGCEDPQLRSRGNRRAVIFTENPSLP